MIKVSFIVIGYNIVSYVERCLMSVLLQTLKEIEVIFVDDGSEDDTIDIVNKLIKDDDRVKIIRQKNQGANAARKTGFTHAKGQYVAFVDGDDWIENNLAEKLYKLAHTDEFDIIAFNYFFAYNKSKKPAKNNKTGTLANYEFLELILINELSHNLWDKLYKRDFLEEAGFLNIPGITMGDDFAANVRLGVCKPKVLVINDYFYYYYQSVGSVTRKISAKILEIEIALNDIEETLRINNLQNIYKEHIEYVRFRNFYIRVVRSRYKSSYIQKRLYRNWKSENIDISKNKFCSEFMSSASFLLKILIYFYDRSYVLGYIMSRIFLGMRSILGFIGYSS